MRNAKGTTVAFCPEVASQESTVAEAREALTLFFETAPVEEIDKRLRSEVCVTHVEVAVGQERDTTTVPDHRGLRR